MENFLKRKRETQFYSIGESKDTSNEHKMLSIGNGNGACAIAAGFDDGNQIETGESRFFVLVDNADTVSHDIQANSYSYTHMHEYTQKRSYTVSYMGDRGIATCRTCVRM